MASLASRVRSRRKALNMSQEDLAAAIGMKQQSIVSIEAGDVERPRKLRELARALQVSEDWLLTGEDPPLPEMRGAEAIPVLGEVAAGLWLESGLHRDEPIGWVPFQPIGSPEKAYALLVRGNSMDKVLPEGSHAICVSIADSGRPIVDGDLVVVERLQVQEQLREVTVKRVKQHGGGFELHPESTDPRWQPVKYGRAKKNSDIEIRVIAHVRWVVQTI